MSHYKSNIRDIEFNLFEVLKRDEILGDGPVRRRRRGHRQVHPGRGRPAGPRGPRRLLRRRRPQPAGLRPEDQHRARAGVVQEELPGLDGRRVLAPRHHGRARRHACPLEPQLGAGRAGARRQPRDLDVRRRPDVRRHPLPQRQRARQEDRPAHRGQGLDHHDGAHRARRRLRRRRRPHQGHPERRRHLEHRGRQALHHLGRERPERQHRAHGARAPGGRRGRRRPGHQGPEPVHRAEVPLRRRDRRATASATAPTSPTSSTRWASRSPTPARSPSATPASAAASRPSATCSARCTTASRRCSRSSRTPG